MQLDGSSGILAGLECILAVTFIATVVYASVCPTLYALQLR